MDDNDQTNELEQLAAEAVAPIGQELRQRLAIELDDRAVLAIESALLKSFHNGMLAGASETAEQAVDQTGISTALAGRNAPNPAELELELAWIDPFAERYRDG